MSTYAKEIITKMERNILRDRYAGLRRNPYLIAEAETGKPTIHPQTVKAARTHIEKWAKENRAAAYIFGDTYEGMPIQKALDIILDEGFGPIGRMPNGTIRFQHNYLGLALVPRCDKNGKLTAIAMDIALTIRPDLVKTSDFVGLGLCDAEVVGKILYASMDATGGFKVKMFALKNMVSAAGVNEPLPH